MKTIKFTALALIGLILVAGCTPSSRSRTKKVTEVDDSQSSGGTTTLPPPTTGGDWNPGGGSDGGSSDGGSSSSEGTAISCDSTGSGDGWALYNFPTMNGGGLSWTTQNLEDPTVLQPDSTLRVRAIVQARPSKTTCRTILQQQGNPMGCGLTSSGQIATREDSYTKLKFDVEVYSPSGSIPYDTISFKDVRVNSSSTTQYCTEPSRLLSIPNGSHVKLRVTNVKSTFECTYPYSGYSCDSDGYREVSKCSCWNIRLQVQTDHTKSFFQ